MNGPYLDLIQLLLQSAEDDICEYIQYSNPESISSYLSVAKKGPSCLVTKLDLWNPRNMSHALEFYKTQTPCIRHTRDTGEPVDVSLIGLLSQVSSIENPRYFVKLAERKLRDRLGFYLALPVSFTFDVQVRGNKMTRKKSGNKALDSIAETLNQLTVSGTLEWVLDSNNENGADPEQIKDKNMSHVCTYFAEATGKQFKISHYEKDRQHNEDGEKDKRRYCSYALAVYSGDSANPILIHRVGKLFRAAEDSYRLGSNRINAVNVLEDLQALLNESVAHGEA